MIKAILFDMDGVLIDSHDAWFHIFNRAYKKFENKKITVKEFDDLIWAKAFEKVAKRYFKAPLEDIRAYYREIYEEYHKRLKIMKNAKQALSELNSKDLKLVVVSNSQKNIVKKVLKDVGLAEYFNLFIGGDDVKNGKPEPDILYKALDLLKLKKEDVLFVGDTKWDRIASKKAKIKFIGFKTDGDERIDDLKELLRFS